MSDGEELSGAGSPFPTPSSEEESGPVAERRRGTNDYFRKMMDRNFLDYANYVIGSRAIPDVDDGLKPVQRRILWALYLVYDGRTQKVANIVGNTMHFHPHGDASIGDALVVLANKGGCIEQESVDAHSGRKRIEYISTPYYINKQGNFGNILTGSPAAAGRYTECGLTKLAYETLFNRDITEFVPNYDGREVEPTVLPAKLPSLLMLGSDGIAVGMSTTILPHNFNELIDAEIAALRGGEFQLYPDFQQGGLMDVGEYDDGNGKIVLRARIDIEGRDLVIREIPATCTTESLVASIERAADKNRIRISSVADFTTDHVEIRVTPTRGYDPEKTRRGLYMYTDCSVSISPKMVVICDRRPVQMSVSQVLRRNVDRLQFYLKRELEIELERQNELRHAKTLAQLFFENRIYKRIEECRSQEAEYREVMSGLAPFRDRLLRDITEADVDKLLALPVRRIARFDIEKNETELREIADRIKAVKHNLAHLTDYAVDYLTEIKNKYGRYFPRRTEIERFEQIDRREAALNNIKIGWDRKNGYVGRSVKSDDAVMCNEFDRFLCTEKSGVFRVIPLPPDKLFVGRLYDFRRCDARTEFGIIYREKKSGKYYGKRSAVGGFILEKEYRFCPPGCVLELFTPRSDAVYVMNETNGRGKASATELNLMELPLRSAKARGILVSTKTVPKLTHLRYLSEEELAALHPQGAPGAAAPGDASPEEKMADSPVAAPAAPPTGGADASVVPVPVSPVEAKAGEEGADSSVAVSIISSPATAAVPLSGATISGISDAAPPVGNEPDMAEAENTAAATPADSPTAVAKRRGRPKRASAAPEEVAAPEVAAIDAAGNDAAVAKRRGRPKRASAAPEEVAETPVKPETQRSDSGSDDDLGIVQPEFGF